MPPGALAPTGDSVFEFIEATLEAGTLRSGTRPRWAYSSVGLEHTPDKREVGSSNLPRPTNIRW